MKARNFNKLGLLIKSAIVFGAVFIAAGCGDDPKPVTAEDVKFTLGTLSKVNSQFYGGRDIRDALVNKDQSVAYVKTDTGSIYRVKLTKDLKGINDVKNWQKLSLHDPSKGGGAGQSALANENNQAGRKIFLGEKGLIVLTGVAVPAGLANNHGALAYFVGDDVTPTHAWTSEATHVAGGALRANSLWRLAASVMKDGKEYIVIANSGGGVVQVSSVEVGPNQFQGTHVKAPVFPSGGAFNLKNIIPAPEGTDEIYFVSGSGVSILKKSDLGTANAIASEDANAAAGKWGILATVANATVKEAILHNNKLFIALDSNGENTGGIAVYNIADKTTTAPNKSWNQTEVSSLHVADGKLKAIFSNGFYDVKDDGTLGDLTVSLLTITQNKLSGKMLAIGEDVSGKTLYRVLESPWSITKVFPFGKDFLINGGSHLYSLTHEERTLGSVKAEEGTSAQ